MSKAHITLVCSFDMLLDGQILLSLYFQSKVVATETSLPGVTLGHLAMAEKQYLGLTFLQVIVVLVVRAVMMVMVVKATV